MPNPSSLRKDCWGLTDTIGKREDQAHMSGPHHLPDRDIWSKSTSKGPNPVARDRELAESSAELAPGRMTTGHLAREIISSISVVQKTAWSYPGPLHFIRPACIDGQSSTLLPTSSVLCCSCTLPDASCSFRCGPSSRQETTGDHPRWHHGPLAL